MTERRNRRKRKSLSESKSLMVSDTYVYPSVFYRTSSSLGPLPPKKRERARERGSESMRDPVAESVCVGLMKRHSDNLFQYF